MRLRALTAALLAFTLAACSSGSADPTPDPTEPGSQMPTVTADDAGNPILEFPDSNAPAGLQVDVVEEGSGREIEKTDTVIANYVGQVWGNSDPFDSSFERGAAASFSLGAVIPGWTQGIAGQKAGSHLILSIPAELGYGPAGGQPEAGISETDTIAFYVEVEQAFGVDQAGQADADMQVSPEDLPINLEGDLGAPVKISVKDGAPEPTGDPVVTVIARGTGDPVGPAGTFAYAQYAMTMWDNSDSEVTYGTFGAQAMRLGDGAWFDSLEGIPVGSRVLIQVPASDGGEQSVTGPAYAVVVDILGQTQGAPEQQQDK